MVFCPSSISPLHFDNAYWFLFSGTEILVEVSADSVSIPYFTDPLQNALSITQPLYLGCIDSVHCFCAEIITNCAPNNYVLKELRTLFEIMDNVFFGVAAKALQIANWDRTHKFCGQCAHPLKMSTSEYAKICPECGLTQYPRISPAIIVAIVRDGRLLLARRSGSKMFSVIAGYVEAGEDLEQTVEREAFEEVGLKVDNIRYFSSQPWAFSYTLMLAFTAEYKSGTIKPDGKEIEYAQWFSPQELPEIIPGKISVARALIDWFKVKYTSNDIITN